MMCIILNTDLLQFRLFGAVYFVLPVFFEYLYKVSSSPSSSWKTNMCLLLDHGCLFH